MARAMRAYNWLKRAVPAWIWVDGLIALVLLVGSAFSYRYWDWLASSTESGSTTVRNIALIVAGLVALILALWRGAIGERQASAAEQAVLDGRYQRAIRDACERQPLGSFGRYLLAQELGRESSVEREAAAMPTTVPPSGSCEGTFAAS